MTCSRLLGVDAETCDPLTVIARSLKQDERCLKRTLLDQQAIPYGFWSRVRD